MTRTTTDSGGAPALRGLVRAGLATPAQERRYFEEVVRPAWDARRHAEGETLDLTAHEIVNTKTTKEEGMEQPYERWLREQAAGETAAAATDMSEEDRMYAAFCEQSGMDDLLGRTPQAPADLSQGSEQVEPSGTVDAGEEAMWNAFVEQSGSGWMFGEADAAAADMTERVQADKQAESVREQAEADELHESLRRQSHEEHFGDAGGMSAEEMWERYRSALGQS